MIKLINGGNILRKTININDSWIFVKENITLEKAMTSKGEHIDLPHTWNGIDGQDGGNDYIRDAFWYIKKISKKQIPANDVIYIEFKGVNASTDLYINNKYVGHHDGGYSTFRFDITSFIEEENTIAIHVDNKKNDRVYPQKADFTFYGGIYRDVNMISVSKNHFDLMHYGSKGLKVTPTLNGTVGILEIEKRVIGLGSLYAKVYDQEGKTVFDDYTENQILIDNVHLWNGVQDPYLYHIEFELKIDHKVVDSLDFNVGFRSFSMDSNEGFFLNGKKYPLRGVCRHQDRPKIGNALSKTHHEEDMNLISSIGANTIRLAHYQHDDYFYELCDKNGLIVWAEIPYISKHMENANNNAKDQMRELIAQLYHHPSIVTWGISNEITISKAGKECLSFHKEMNELVHELDSTRKTVVANYMPMRIKNKLNRIPDIVSYNLYFGWYLPFTNLAGWKLDRYHKLFPNEIIGLSEYGAEGVKNVHNRYPHRGDNTEAYQVIYHQKMLDIINKRDYLWATHVWNMFDFAADARNQGGEPGMNHKGLVTFDRKRLKDSFYVYKAYWSNDSFIHICNKKYEKRTGRMTEIKVYSNLSELEIIHNDQCVFKGKVNKVVRIKVPMVKNNHVIAKSGEFQDESTFTKVKRKPSEYKLRKQKNISWEK